MGTSHRHKASIVGQPNWGDSSAAVTGIAEDIKKEEELNDQLQKPQTPKQKVQTQKKLSVIDKRVRSNYHKAVRNLVRAAGGRARVSSGSSHAVGSAGISIANGFINTFNEIVSNGLNAWLKKKGVDTLLGKSCKEVLDLIRSYIDYDITGLDDTAANEALEHVMATLENRIGDDIEKFEEIMGNILNGEEIKDILDEFFGIYIYSHLSQDFSEKLEYEKGTEIMLQTMAEIKELILEDVKFGILKRPAEQIDWTSPESQIYIRKEFDRILFILSDDED